MKPEELKESTKKPYEAPKLSVYGDIREITRNVGDMKSLDGGSGKTPKSQAG